MIGAIVIGGDYRGLGVVRSLGRRGIPVWVLTDEHHVAATSRYTRRHYAWPAGGAPRQIEFLLELARRHGVAGWALIPTGDETAALLAQHRACLAEHYRVTTPPWETLRWAYDKRLTHQLALELAIAQPWTHNPLDRNELVELECPFPAILKPAVKPQLNRFTRAKAWQVDDRQALLAGYDAACAFAAPGDIIVQELIPGGGEEQLSFAGLCRDGEPLACLTARRARQYPIDFGRSSSFVETIRQPEVEQTAIRILRALRYTGLIEVEFKLDRRDGRCKLLELNPRVWGWHTLGRLAGLDFPYLLWRLACGMSMNHIVSSARPGLRWLHLRTDLPALMQGLRRGVLSPSAYLASLRGPLEFAIFAKDDPLPAMLDLPLLAYLGWRRRSLGISQP
ncbi:MAG: ATP-grasp domain-containing protein [Chloroflexi bacterium]|nr:ATP-grasp domain-containing protein [Chloroflexota bacterium]